MSMVTRLPWHRDAWRFCQQAINLNRVPQALLIKGAPGVGKLHLARQFAAALLCEQRTTDTLACGVCHACSLLQAGTHADYQEVTPEEGKALGIDMIRELLPKLALKPLYKSYRVVLLYPAEQMNTASANAFLKCLEEPNERTVIILVSAYPNRLPLTIVSRCQQLQLHKPDSLSALAWLRSQQVTENAALLLMLARGAPLNALSFAENQTLNLRQQCFADWCQIATQQQHPVSVAEQWQKLPIPLVLDWLCSWVVDIVKLHYACDQALFYNQDLLPLLQDKFKQLELKKLLLYYQLLLQQQQNCHTTLNKQLMCETILIHWSRLHRLG